MSAILIVDTSIFVEILAVPGKAQAVAATRDQLETWIGLDATFIDHASAGVSMADASLIELWEQQRARFSARRVLIWSLDDDLSSYDSGEP